MSLKEQLKNQLLSELSRKNTDLITAWILENPNALESLIELIFIHHKKISPRAAWVLEKLAEKQHEPAKLFLPLIIKELPTLPFSGTRRTLTKVLMLHTIPEKYEGDVLNFCISMLESVKEPVAVKANCMTIIFNLLPKYPDLKNEIFAIIEDQLPHNSVGFKSRFNVLKRRLK